MHRKSPADRHFHAVSAPELRHPPARFAVLPGIATAGRAGRFTDIEP